MVLHQIPIRLNTREARRRWMSSHRWLLLNAAAQKNRIDAHVFLQIRAASNEGCGPS